ncbi:hypothetical protein [Emticicia agri]|uniref:Uncharacterized protein n=1 Tax=Emticicia agri TaxID=2492393 RepID=A0A4Q5M2F0_9BACT|nr:hypothetical protein [Emticicia agri]RYU96275.1 hypothetical protein EWM59_07105 [Emticicia agri]
MKTFVLLFTLVALPCCLIGQELYNPAKDYRYFIRDSRISDNNQTKIVINDKGDTTLVAHYKSQDGPSRTFQEFTKVFKGTPFFKNGWYKGIMSSENGKDMSFLMAYNIQKNVVYVVENAKMDAVAVRPEEFTIEGHTFRKYEDIFLETLYMQRNILLKGYSCVLSTGYSEKTGYDTQSGTAAYEGEFRKYHKYFTIQDDMLRAVPTGKKALQTFPKGKRPLLEQFVKTNHINLKTEQGLIEVFRYYDSLGMM